MRSSLVRLLLFWGLLPLFFIFSIAKAENPGTGIPPNESRTLGKPLPHVRLVDHTGKVFNLYDLKGKPLILSPIYTHCQSACPLITESLKDVVPKLGKPGKDFWVLSFTFDPQDTVEDLVSFRKEKGIKGEEGWLTVKAYSREELFRLLDAIDLRFMSIPQTRDFVHPNMVVFVSPDMVVKRYVYGVVFKEDEMRKALNYSVGKVELLELLRPYLFLTSFLGVSLSLLFVLLKLFIARLRRVKFHVDG